MPIVRKHWGNSFLALQTENIMSLSTLQMLCPEVLSAGCWQRLTSRNTERFVIVAADEQAQCNRCWINRHSVLSSSINLLYIYKWQSCAAPQFSGGDVKLFCTVNRGSIRMPLRKWAHLTILNKTTMATKDWICSLSNKAILIVNSHRVWKIITSPS